MNELILVKTNQFQKYLFDREKNERISDYFHELKILYPTLKEKVRSNVEKYEYYLARKRNQNFSLYSIKKGLIFPNCIEKDFIKNDTSTVRYQTFLNSKKILVESDYSLILDLEKKEVLLRNKKLKLYDSTMTAIVFTDENDRFFIFDLLSNQLKGSFDYVETTSTDFLIVYKNSMKTLIVPGEKKTKLKEKSFLDIKENNGLILSLRIENKLFVVEVFRFLEEKKEFEKLFRAKKNLSTGLIRAKIHQFIVDRETNEIDFVVEINEIDNEMFYFKLKRDKDGYRLKSFLRNFKEIFYFRNDQNLVFVSERIDKFHEKIFQIVEIKKTKSDKDEVDLDQIQFEHEFLADKPFKKVFFFEEENFDFVELKFEDLSRSNTLFLLKFSNNEYQLFSSKKKKTIREKTSSIKKAKELLKESLFSKSISSTEKTERKKRKKLLL